MDIQMVLPPLLSNNSIESPSTHDPRTRRTIDNQPPLRILRVVQDTYPEMVGGVGIHAAELSRDQAELGHDITVLTSDRGDRSLARRETRDGYTLLRHSEVIRPFDNSITPGIVWNVLKRSPNYDLIDVHSHLYFISNVTAIIGAVTDTPVVVTNHGLVSQTAPPWLQHVFNRTLGRITFQAADRVICLSETDQDRLRDLGVNVPATVIPSGIDTDLFSPDSSIKRKKQLLFVGRLKEGKGPHYLLNAFSAILDTHPEYSLKLIGGGPMYDELIKLATEMTIEDSVYFDSNISVDKLVRLYNESQVFILPSSSEGLPRTVLEAMACKTPVVVTDLEQLRPVVNGAGIMVEPRSPAQLAREISSLLEDDNLRRELGKTGRRRVNSSYTWEQTVNKTIASYYDTL